MSTIRITLNGNMLSESMPTVLTNVEIGEYGDYLQGEYVEGLDIQSLLTLVGSGYAVFNVDNEAHESIQAFFTYQHSIAKGEGNTIYFE